MKNLLKITLPVLACLLMAFKAVRYFEKQKVIALPPPAKIVITPIEIQVELPKIKLYTHEDFLEDLGHYESSNRYDITNRWGYMGRYQFHISTLRSLGINTTKKEFLNDPGLQEEAMDRLLTSNYRSLKKYIKKYEGKTKHGIIVTKSGILAAAHLGGAGNVSRWFRRGKNFADGNGTEITTYMKVFGGYSLNL